ncbi:hypothetical protein L596_025505 [Steinernema carpocapsae]|uniref:Uncharacterized protein n=1 Tax=Steinernema carpocapsae TaxID=34508 RepID=A0A4U5M7X8_STECR|nr:hypothetical protein L596_025505 [Steinernema carpocapsae]
MLDKTQLCLFTCKKPQKEILVPRKRSQNAKNNTKFFSECDRSTLKTNEARRDFLRTPLRRLFGSLQTLEQRPHIRGGPKKTKIRQGRRHDWKLQNEVISSSLITNDRSVSLTDNAKSAGRSRRLLFGPPCSAPTASRPGTCPVFGQYREVRPGTLPLRESREALGNCFPPGRFQLVGEYGH